MEGRTISGKYALERELARGGMGAVWAAFDASLRRRVALKLMSPDHVASKSARSRFEREAMAIAQLTSPNVVQIYDYGIDGDAPYIVMELLEGEDLQSRLTRVGRMPPAAVASLLTQTGKALSAAHASGIVHRDIKPANIFLARHDGDETVKVLDFGVAALVSGLMGADMHVTRAGGVVGTPHYMSPEQVRGSRGVDFRSDLWSLAVVAYRALTGRLPFEAEAFGELLIQICTDPIPAPSKAVPELGPDFDAFFERALARDPARRYPSAREMASAFTAAAAQVGGRGERASKILVVDDEPDVAVLMKQRFRQQIRKGIFEFVFAGDGEAALEQLRLHPDIEIALTDINMPGMDGLTFLRKAGELNPLVKVVVVSAYSDMSNIREAMNRGAFDFLVKPIDFKDLELTINKTVSHAREARRTQRSSEENSLLRMFVSSGIVERLLPLLRTPDAAEPGARPRASADLATETIEASVAFIDICGFTPLTANEPPDQALRTLNANFEIIVPEITSRGGVIDKFLGDAVMAVFRAPLSDARASSPDLSGAQAGERPRALGAQAGERPRALGAQAGERPRALADQPSPPPAAHPAEPAHTPDAPASVVGQAGHLERALEACVAARKALADMAARAGEGSPYAHGITAGVDSGPMICGSIGSRVASRLDYTVLGEVVNNAARLQSMAHKGQILVNAALCHRIEGVFQCQPVMMMGGDPPYPPARPVPGEAQPAVYDVLQRVSDAAPLSSAETLLMEESEMDVSHERSSTGDVATPLPA